MAKRVRLLLCIAVMMIVSGSLVYAIPSYRGYTGLMIIPTADALCKGSWNVGVFSENVADTATDYIVNYGLAPGLEVGFDRFLRNTPFHGFEDSGGEKTLLSAKYAFYQESDTRPGIAAGIFDVTNDLESTVYIVASKSLTERMGTYEGQIITPRLHIGFGGGYFSGVFGGLSTYLGNRLQLSAEWDSRNVQLGGNFRVARGLFIYAGVFDVTDRDNTTFGTGISYGRYY